MPIGELVWEIQTKDFLHCLLVTNDISQIAYSPGGVLAHAKIDSPGYDGKNLPMT
jgi:hypothetical protein